MKFNPTHRDVFTEDQKENNSQDLSTCCGQETSDAAHFRYKVCERIREGKQESRGLKKRIATGADGVLVEIGHGIRGRGGPDFEDEVFTAHRDGGDAPPDEEDLNSDTTEARDLTRGDVSGDGGLVFDGVQIGDVDGAGGLEVELESAIVVVDLVA
ncbi:hypothetical protein L7F22_045893 [Adiantum nelumboides]|nr:hypothetical protein [Adiantum nelumboides]